MSNKQNKNFPGLRDGVYAFSHPEEDRIIAMSYEVEGIGLFLRKGESWKFATEKELYNLMDGDHPVFDIERSKALEIVEMFDDASAEGKSLSVSDLDGYLEEEGSE